MSFYTPIGKNMSILRPVGYDLSARFGALLEEIEQ